MKPGFNVEYGNTDGVPVRGSLISVIWYVSRRMSRQSQNIDLEAESANKALRSL